MKKIVLTAAMVIGLAAGARAQCPGDPTSGNPILRQAVFTLGQSIPATSGDAMLRMAVALQGQGHAVSVMDNNGPSDHKAWVDGEGWTFRSSDPVRCPTVTWSPYVQAPYDGSGFSACGIPTSAHLACPSWFTPPLPVAPTPVVLPPVTAPAPVPAVVPLNLDLTPLLTRFDQLIALEKDTNDQVTSMNRTLGQTFGAVMAFVGKYIAPAVAAYITARQMK